MELIDELEWISMRIRQLAEENNQEGRRGLTDNEINEIPFKKHQDDGRDH